MSPIFLLSPAYCGGRRAAILLNPESPLPLAARLREGTPTLGEAFAFLSGLYFRGKLAYASAFDPAGARTLVITLGSRLHYPASFVGRGDMSRGGLLLRQARAGEELEYAVFDPGAARRGPRPPKLTPLPKITDA
jgi:hypothetical protein